MLYLVRFLQVQEHFRLPELESICRIQNVLFPHQDVCAYDPSCPFWIANFPNDNDVKLILERSVVIKEISRLIAIGDSFDQLVAETKENISYFNSIDLDLSFKFHIDDYQTTILPQNRLQMINSFSFLPLQGEISMTNPNLIFTIHVDGIQGKHYFTQFISQGRRDLIDRFNVKKRAYIGTTSMDSELSLLMANIGLARPNCIMYDPFVGTGSLLCTAAQFSSFVLGSDIDGRQIRGSPNKSSKSLMANFQQYQLENQLLGTLVFDILQNPWRSAFQVDAIITDPPYGVRAGAKKIGNSNNRIIQTLSAEERAIRYPNTIPYEMDHLVIDLLEFACKHLAIGGRLVFWYAAGENKARVDTETVLHSLPSHTPGLQFIYIIHQPCRQFDRWLLVYERTH